MSNTSIAVLINSEDIVVPPNRFRQEFREQPLEDLTQSIRSTGLIHPISVEPDKTGGKWILRAGERRLRAMRSLIAAGVSFRCGEHEIAGGLVPVIEWNKLTEIQRLELEVSENLDRTDFTWQERTRAIQTRHKLRTLQQGKPPTAAAIATEIDGKPDNYQAVTRALVVAKHLDNPDVAKAKSEKDAFKIIEKNAKAVKDAQLAKTFDLNKVQHRLIHGDCLTLLPTLPAAAFDVLLTDPPYGIDADDFGPQATTTHEYRDSRKRWEQIMSVFPDESYRVTKPRAHAYVFCDPRLFPRLETLMCLAGWRVFSTPIIWVKGDGMLPFPMHGPRRTYECILYAWKGDRETRVVRDDAITNIPPVKGKHHAAQKPVALYQELLSRSANPGDTVLDCFGGSGTILVAANRLRLTATYIEQIEAQYNIAVTRSSTKDIDDGAEADDGIQIKLD